VFRCFLRSFLLTRTEARLYRFQADKLPQNEAHKVALSYNPSSSAAGGGLAGQAIHYAAGVYYALLALRVRVCECVLLALYARACVCYFDLARARVCACACAWMFC
jgi:hypothetical protein